MWDLIVSVPDHCLSFYFESLEQLSDIVTVQMVATIDFESLEKLSDIIDIIDSSDGGYHRL